MKVETEEYFDLEKRKEVINKARKLRKEFLRYREAEVVYSIQHKKLIELADDAGALYRIDGYVLIESKCPYQVKIAIGSIVLGAEE